MASSDDLLVEIKILTDKTRDDDRESRYEIEVDSFDFGARFDLDIAEDYGF